MHSEDKTRKLEQRCLLAITEFNKEVLSAEVARDRQGESLAPQFAELLEHLANALAVISNHDDFWVCLHFNDLDLVGQMVDGDYELLGAWPGAFAFDVVNERMYLPWRFWDVVDQDGALIGKRLAPEASEDDSINCAQMTITMMIDRNHALDDWEMMLSHLVSQTVLFGTFYAIAEGRFQTWMRRQLERRHQQYQQLKDKTEEMVNRPWSSVYNSAYVAFRHLQELLERADDAVGHQIVPLAIKIYEKTLLELLNLGRMIRVIDEDRARDMGRPSPLHEIFASVASIQAVAKQHGLASSLRRLRTIEISFQALFNQRETLKAFIGRVQEHCAQPTDTPMQDRIYELFNFWIYLEKAYRNANDRVVKYCSVELEQAFRWSLIASLDTLGAFLCESLPQMQRGVREADNMQFRNMLHLWFCYQHLLLMHRQLREAAAHAAHGIGQLRYRADLAYVLREALRFEIFSPRTDFAFNEATFVTSLKSLTEYYVHLPPEQGGPIGLPETYDVGRFLSELGQVWGVTSANSPLQYLNHVLHVLIAGLFFLEIEIRSPDGRQRAVAAHLVAPNFNTASQEAVREFKQSFALAVLFHDVSHVVCPFEEGAGTSLISEKRLLKLNLASVEETLKRAGSGIAETCYKDLLAAGYLDVNSDTVLVNWLEGQVASGEPDHGLISAWYLHHLCEGSKLLIDDMLQNAVRAILVHNAVAVSLNIEQDAVAAFLVLSNELFEWDLGAPFQVSTHDRFDQSPVLVSPDSLQMSRYRQILLKRLQTQFELHQRGSLEDLQCPEVDPLELGFSTCDMVVHLSEDNPTWPHFFVGLQEPEYLDVPVMAIWLTKAQTFARFVTHQANGWRPQLTIQNAKPPLRLQKGLQTEELLALLALHSRLPFRPYLKRWLLACREQQCFESLVLESEQDQFGEPEAIRIHNLDEPFFYEDIRKWMPRLIQEAEELLRLRH